MNGRPEGPSPALLAAQRRLEEARRSYQLTADRCQRSGIGDRGSGIGYQQPANGERRTAVSDRWSVVSYQPPAASHQSPAPSPQPPAPDPYIALHPSIALAMLKAGLAASGRIWLLLRHLDQDGRGWLALDQVQQQLCTKGSEMRVCGRRQLRNLLGQGQGIFWQRDKSRVWLRSAARVAIALEVDRLRGRPVALPLVALLEGMGQVRAHFYATFHSGRPGKEESGPGRLISRTTLHRLSHVPARTQRLYEQRTGVEVSANIAVGERLTEANFQERAWRHGRATFTFTDNEGKQGPAGGRYVAWRLPNSYQGPHALSSKGRMKKINHQIDLVNSRVQGNELDRAGTWQAFDRLFQTSGREAGRAFNRDQRRDIYWPAGRPVADGRRLWHVLPGRGPE